MFHRNTRDATPYADRAWTIDAPSEDLDDQPVLKNPTPSGTFSTPQIGTKSPVVLYGDSPSQFTAVYLSVKTNIPAPAPRTDVQWYQEAG